jgi:hypothetical protein
VCELKHIDEKVNELLDRIADLTQEKQEMLDCLIKAVKFHRKYEICYKEFGRDHIKFVIEAIIIIEKATGKNIEEVIK